MTKLSIKITSLDLSTLLKRMSTDLKKGRSISKKPKLKSRNSSRKKR